MSEKSLPDPREQTDQMRLNSKQSKDKENKLRGL